MSKCGQAAQRPLDPSRERGVAVDALLGDGLCSLSERDTMSSEIPNNVENSPPINNQKLVYIN
jgi:hypothetical protein